MNVQTHSTDYSVVTRLLSAGKLQEAISELESLSKADPTSLGLRIQLADLYAQGKRQEEAIEILMDLGKRYEDKRASLKAMGIYIQVLRLDPRYKPALKALSHHYIEHGLYTEVAELFEAALSRTGNAERLELVDLLLSLDPENIRDRIRLGEAYSALGHLKEAAKQFRAPLNALDTLDDKDSYRLVAERLLYHEADTLMVGRRLAEIYVSSDEPQRALPKLRSAYERRSEDITVLNLLVDSFEQLGQTHKAVTVAKEMARIYDDGGLVQERDRCYARIRKLDPNDPVASKAVDGRSEEIVETFDLSHAKPLPGAAVMSFASDDGMLPEITIVDEVYTGTDGSADLMLDFDFDLAGSQTDEERLEEAMQELDFYLSNGLFEEAENLLATIKARHGGDHSAVEARLQALKASQGGGHA